MKNQCAILLAVILAGSVATVARADNFAGEWAPVGPSPFQGLNPSGPGREPMSGQVSAIAVDVANDPSGNTVYVGSSSGGLWKSTNGLSSKPTFVPLSDQSESLSVGAIALDTRVSPPIIYVGSGAPDNASNISSYTGIGILRSADGGKKWTTVSAADNGAHSFVGLGFSSILIDPQNTNIMLAATGIGTDPNFPFAAVPQGNPAFLSLGIYRSENAGATWKQVMSGNYGTQPAGFGCCGTPTVVSPGGFFHMDLVYEPTQGIYYAGVTGRGIFSSTDHGSTWKPLKDLGLGAGLPPADKTFRISLATRGGVLWALLLVNPAPTSTAPAPAFALFQSDDNAGTWQHIAHPLPPSVPPTPPPPSPKPTLLPSIFKGALMYVAAPPNSETLLVATQYLYRKENIQNPGSQWAQVGQTTLHGDQHAIAFANAATWYTGDDGGAWATKSHGNNWTSLNADLQTLEFFSADEDSGGSSTLFAGGMQDNGPALTSSSPAWNQYSYGDGTYVEADPQNPTGFFASETNGNIFYVSPSNLGNPTPLVTFGAANVGPSFLAPFEILPPSPAFASGVTGRALTIINHGRILLAAGRNPWLIAFDPAVPPNPCNFRQAPTPCHPNLPSNPHVVLLTKGVGNVINYIATVPEHPTTAYLSAGTSLFKLTNITFGLNLTSTGEKLNNVHHIKGTAINGDLLGHLAVSGGRTPALYIAKVGFLAGQKIFKTFDDGQRWLNVSGNLPNVPVNWITVDPNNPNTIYVATNTGVFVATDGGIENERWQKLGTGLPNVPVVQLKIAAGRKLLAATYGRNVWMLTEPFKSVEITINTGNDDARSDTELWATISGEPTVCLKPSNNADPDDVCKTNGGSAHDQNGKQSWDNWTASTQHFSLPTTSNLVGSTITIKLIEHNHGFETDDNWDIQGMRVNGIDADGNAVTLLNMGNAPDPHNADNCMARLRGTPTNPGSVAYNLSPADPAHSNLRNLTFGQTPPGSCPQ